MFACLSVCLSVCVCEEVNVLQPADGDEGRASPELLDSDLDPCSASVLWFCYSTSTVEGDVPGEQL